MNEVREVTVTRTKATGEFSWFAYVSAGDVVRAAYGRTMTRAVLNLNRTIKEQGLRYAK